MRLEINKPGVAVESRDQEVVGAEIRRRLRKPPERRRRSQIGEWRDAVVLGVGLLESK